MSPVQTARHEAVPLSADRIRVVGVGGAGLAAVDAMRRAWTGNPVVAAIDTDARALADLETPVTLELGRHIARGLGAGGDPRVGRTAAEVDSELLHGLFTDCDLALVTAGLGAGTGSGATPVVLRAASDSGAITICFVTLPYAFEGRSREANARRALHDIREVADVVVVLPNNRHVECGAERPLARAMEEATDALARAVRALWAMLTCRGTLCVGVQELRRMLRVGDQAFGFGFGEAAGEGRVAAAVEDLARCPLLLNGEVLGQSSAVLVHLVAEPDLRLDEVQEAMDRLRPLLRNDADIVLGVAGMEGWGDRLSVAVFAGESWDAPLSRVLGAAVPDHARPTRAAAGGAEQMLLDIVGEADSRSRFQGVAPTVEAGEDLDVPTFQRQGLVLEK